MTTTATIKHRALAPGNRRPARPAHAGRALFWILRGVILTGLLAIAGPGSGGEIETRELAIGEQCLEVEIADRSKTRQRGLMFRPFLPEDAGMLFVYPRAQRLSFWMQNTLIPLDIAFIDADGVITEFRQMRPLDTRNTVSAGAVPYALEVNAGWFERHGIEPGEQVRGLPDWRAAEP